MTVSRAEVAPADPALPWRVVRKDDAEYPSLLEHVDPPPQQLYVLGRNLATLPPCVAVVGTRTPTGYGQEIAYALASDFARAGLCVVSGLARGIDAWAHTGALEYGSTAAVLANHRVGQAVCDRIEPRHKGILPDYVWGDGAAAGVRQRAVEEMIATIRLAQKLE